MLDAIKTNENVSVLEAIQTINVHSVYCHCLTTAVTFHGKTILAKVLFSYSVYVCTLYTRYVRWKL